MFKEIRNTEYLGYDEKTDQYSWRIKIVDTDFEEFAVIVRGRYLIEVEIAIIDCYTRRGLPIAPNLIRYMLECQDKCGDSLDAQVKWNKLYNSRWKEIEEDMQVYLTFS